MSPTRRQFLLTGTGGITALSGCSALSDPQQPLLLAVNNYTESRHQGHVLIEKDGAEVVHQYVEVGAAESDAWATIETKIALGEIQSGTPLDVTASFGDGLKASGQHTLDCSIEYNGRAIYVQIEKEKPVNVRLNLACYDEFPSNEAIQGGINHSRVLFMRAVFSGPEPSVNLPGYNTEVNTRGESGTYVEILGTPCQGWIVVARVNSKIAHEQGHRTKKKALKETVDRMEHHQNPKVELCFNSGSGFYDPIRKMRYRNSGFPVTEISSRYS